MTKNKRNPYPDKERGLEICIAVTKRGIKVYGNQQAFRTFARWMSWIARAPEAEHFSLSLNWHLMSKFTKRRNVFVLVDDEMKSVFGSSQEELTQNFDITFVAVEKADLKALRQYQDSGILPSGWEQAGEDR